MRIFTAVLLFCCLSYSQGIKPPKGFQDIPFGIVKDTFKTKWLEKYNNENCNEDNKYEYFYNDSVKPCYELKDEGVFVVENYKLGNKLFKLFIIFNRNGKFYNYTFYSRDYSANHFETSLISDVEYLSKVFQKKFGNPASKYPPKFFNVKDGNVSYYWKWYFKKQTVYTGLSTYESEYHAVASVSNDDLEREDKIIMQKEELKSIDTAANQF